MGTQITNLILNFGMHLDNTEHFHKEEDIMGWSQRKTKIKSNK